MIGTALLWAGWYGFNAGSAVAANSSAAMVALSTQVATAAAALSWMIVEWIVHRKPTVLALLGHHRQPRGDHAGYGFVDPLGALVIGLAAGLRSATSPRRRGEACARL